MCHAPPNFRQIHLHDILFPTTTNINSQIAFSHTDYLPEKDYTGNKLVGASNCVTSLGYFGEPHYKKLSRISLSAIDLKIQLMIIDIKSEISLNLMTWNI